MERGCCADSELKRGQGAERTAGAPPYSRGGGRGVRCHDGQVGHGIREKERSQRAWPEQLGKWSCLFLNQGKLDGARLGSAVGGGLALGILRL